MASKCYGLIALGTKEKICYKDDGDSGKVGRCRPVAGGAGDERQRQCAAVTITRLTTAAQEAVEETEASRQP